MGNFITAEEVVRAQKWLNEQGLEVQGIGGTRLGRALGVSERRARSILKKLRGEESLFEYPTSTAQTPEDAVGNKRLKMDNDSLKARINELLAQQVLDQKYQEFISEVSGLKREYPKWVVAPKSGKKNQAMPVSHMSDWHFDEVVDPKQVGFVNGYNREIATKRLRRFFEKVISICDEYLTGVDYPGIVVPVSGDMFSGDIHEELRETNESSLCESLHYWLDPMGAGLQMLAERFGKVFVPWVVGNHPRMSQKPKSKGGVRDNFDWLLGAMLQRDFARMGEKRIQFQIADSFDNYFQIYSSRYCQTHGDSFKGGTGISGHITTLALGDARKRKRSQAMNAPYDYLIHGHWHSRVCQPVIKGNGAAKGFDEYALKANFGFEEPIQSFWLDTPEHKITMEAPIFVKCPNEGWERKHDGEMPVFRAA